MKHYIFITGFITKMNYIIYSNHKKNIKFNLPNIDDLILQDQEYNIF